MNYPWATLCKSNTFWWGLGGIIAAIGSACPGVITWDACIVAILGSIQSINLKKGQIKQVEELQGPK